MPDNTQARDQESIELDKPTHLKMENLLRAGAELNLSEEGNIVTTSE